MGLGPFDLTGGPFLVLYMVMLALAWAASGRLTDAFRPQGRPGRIDSQDDLAALSGGPVRLAEAAVARLLAARKLVQHGRSEFMAVDIKGGATPTERAILHIAQPADWRAIEEAASWEYSAIERRLENSGLMVDAAQHLRLRMIHSAPLVLALLFGSIKLIVGLERGKPVGFLTTLLIFNAILAAYRFVRTSALTNEGRLLLERERERSDRIRRAPETDEMGHSVALYGTAVLAGSAFADFHTMRSRQGDSGGDGGGSSSSSGGDGGCGGGCGGCGG